MYLQVAAWGMIDLEDEDIEFKHAEVMENREQIGKTV